MKIFIIAIIVCSFLFSCGSRQPEPSKEESKQEPTTNEVTINRQQMKTAGIELGMIAEKNLKSAIKTNGLLSVPNQNKAFITSVNSGVIKTLLIQPGSFVRKGQTVATILNPDAAKLQQDLQTINAQQSLSEIEYHRQKELVEGNAAPLKNVQRLQMELTTLKVTKNSLEKQLSAMGISLAGVNKGNIVTTLNISAPISGTISNVSAQIGSNIDSSTPIAQIVNNDQLHLDLFVFEKDLPKLRSKQTIHFTLTNDPGKEYDAQIFSIGTAFASENKTIPIHAVVKGDKTGLIEGMNITALISISDSVLPAVPSDAIVNFQGQDYIFVRIKSGTEKNQNKGESQQDTTDLQFARVPVMKGASDIGFTQVTLLRPVAPDAQLITKGAFFVMAKMNNTGHEE